MVVDCQVTANLVGFFALAYLNLISRVIIPGDSFLQWKKELLLSSVKMHRFYFSNRRRRLKIFGIPNHILSFVNDRLDFLNVIVISGMDVMDLLLGDKVHLLTDPMFLEAVENLLHYHVF